MCLHALTHVSLIYVCPASLTAMEGMENADMLLEPNLEEVLQEGVNRLKERSTWKLWTWPSQPMPHVEQKEFVEAEAFRQHLVVSLVSCVSHCKLLFVACSLRHTACSQTSLRTRAVSKTHTLSQNTPPTHTLSQNTHTGANQ